MIPNYVHDLNTHNTSAASKVLPVIFGQVGTPYNLLDVGCGLGTWAGIAKGFGVTEVLGIDSEYVDADLRKLFLADNEFIAHDLTTPFDFGRYDMTVCLEVAEHLPEEIANNLVESLCVSSQLIVFSAAIPNQGGQNHINEQWLSYWREKFMSHNYVCQDIVRPIIWNNKEIDWWYRQNIVLFARYDRVISPHYPSFYGADLVHPDCFAWRLPK